MFSKLKSRLSATKFEFSIHVHSLAPWPAGNRAIAVGWQRGKKRKGATKSVFPSMAPGKLGSSVRFGDSFTLSATLYKDPNAKGKTAVIGPFKKKCLILAVLETDNRTNAVTALGRVVIDLSEYASIDGQELRTFHVACNKAIHAAVGDPTLTITIRCRWKKAGQQFSNDEVLSMSTDTTGSQLTSNLSSMLRHKFDKNAIAPPNEEQDLQGFEHKLQMEAIQEGDEPPSPPRPSPSSYPVVTTPFSQKGGDDDDAEGDKPQQGAASSSSQTPGLFSAFKSKWRQGSGREEGRPSPAADATAAAARAASPSPGPGSKAEASSDRAYLAAPISAPAAGPPPAIQLDQVTAALSGELLATAATEMALYVSHLHLAPAGLAPPGRRAHAPARRIARSLVSMQQEDGISFGRTALKLMNEMLKTAAQNDDVAGTGFWYSNAVHLRAMLQGLQPAEGGSARHWATHMFVPQLLSTERWAFEHLLAKMWDDVLIPAAGKPEKLAAGGFSSPSGFSPSPGGFSPSPGGGARPLSSPTGAMLAAAKANGGQMPRRALQEVAIRNWINAFDQVNSKLAPLHSDPHGYLLKGQIILQCLKRADALFFQHMLCIVKGQDWLAEYMPDASLWDGRGVPALSEEVLLPVPRGSLTFSAGMAAKVAATRLQQWAFQEAVLRDIWGTMAEALGGEAALPLLKGAAELLMMPKELLMDDGIRADVASCLSLRTVLQILERFAPDEFAGDVVHPSIIAAVKEEMKGKAAEGKDKKADKKPGAEAAENKPTRQPVRLSCAYHTPEEGRVMEAVTRGEEPGIEYDADSEAELESMSCLTSPVQDNSVRATRFGLLHQLWAAGVPRRRA